MKRAFKSLHNSIVFILSIACLYLCFPLDLCAHLKTGKAPFGKAVNAFFKDVYFK